MLLILSIHTSGTCSSPDSWGILTKCPKKGVEIEIHILCKGDKRIRKVYDRVINTLKKNKELREKFESLKRSLNGKSIEEYKKIKSDFLQKNIFNS